MKYTAALVLATISMVYGGLVGPSARSTIVGPDGSAITSATDGGSLHGGAFRTASEVLVGGGARLVAAPGAWAGQGVWAGQGAWAAPGVGLARLGSVIQGPSGIISTNGNPWGAINGRSVGIVQSVGPLGLGLQNGVWRR